MKEFILLSTRMSREPNDAVTRLVGQRIKALRIEAGLTLERLAFLAELSKGHLSKLERGLQSPTVTTLDVIAPLLDAHGFDFMIDPDADARQALIDATRALTRSQIQELLTAAIELKQAR